MVIGPMVKVIISVFAIYFHLQIIFMGNLLFYSVENKLYIKINRKSDISSDDESKTLINI